MFVFTEKAIKRTDLIRATLHSDISNHPQYQRFSSQYENATLHYTSINKNAFCKLSRKYSNQNTFVAEKNLHFAGLLDIYLTQKFHLPWTHVITAELHNVTSNNGSKF